MAAMKYLIVLLTLFFAEVQAVYKESPSEAMTPVIASTEKLLQRQKELKTLLEKYQALNAQYLNHMDDRALALETGKTAHEALERIKEDKLVYLFDPSLISEMTLFAKLAAKPSIPKLP